MESYDVIIIGAGPAGLSCAIQLGKSGLQVLVLEKRKSLRGKVCGDGLTVRAIKDLSLLEIDPTQIAGKKVLRKVVSKNGVTDETSFEELFGFEYEYGVSRDIFDECLLEHAINNGVEIVFNSNVESIIKSKDICIVNNAYKGKNVVIACGAIGGYTIGGIKPPSKIPIGMSSRIIGETEYDDDAFYYFYDDKYGNGYAWLFPVGEKIWNVGVWSSDKKEIKKLYVEFEKRIFAEKILYDRVPKGALIGATCEKINSESEYLCIGDSAFNADFYTGEGISFAIENGIDVAMKIVSMYSCSSEN